MLAAKKTELKAIKTVRLYEQIADQIGGLIRERQFAPGDRLPPERDLAKRLGVSRPSIREAMIALETAGLIEVRTGDGTYVREVPADDFRFPWAKDGDPGPGPLEQFEARYLIEPLLAGRAAERASEADIAELERLLAEMEISYQGDVDQDTAGYHFHAAVARIAGNGILARLVSDLWGMRHAEMWRKLRSRVVRREHIEAVLRDRRALVKAVARHDSDGARDAMLQLLDRARHRYFD